MASKTTLNRTLLELKPRRRDGANNLDASQSNLIGIETINELACDPRLPALNRTLLELKRGKGAHQ